MSNTAQNLRSALDLFDGGKNWIRGAMWDGRGCYCAVGAVNKVTGRDSDLLTAYLTTPEFLALQQAIVDVDGPKWLNLSHQSPAHDVAEFNDDQTNFAMVERVFKRAIQIAEEK